MRLVDLVAAMAALTIVDTFGRRTLMPVGSVGSLVGLGSVAAVLLTWDGKLSGASSVLLWVLRVVPDPEGVPLNDMEKSLGIELTSDDLWGRPPNPGATDRPSCDGADSHDVTQVAHRLLEVGTPVPDQVQVVVRRLADAPLAHLEEVVQRADKRHLCREGQRCLRLVQAVQTGEWKRLCRISRDGSPWLRAWKSGSWGPAAPPSRQV